MEKDRKTIHEITQLLPELELNQKKDEHRFHSFVHTHKKDLDQAMLLNLQQPRL